MKVKKHPRRFKSSPVVPQFENANIDAKNGIIKDVVMCQVGPAKGHGVHLEQSFIDDLVAYAKGHHASAGLKARFGHPAMSDTTMGKQMGSFKNFRVRDGQAIADLHLLESADKSPSNPNMREWMLSMAKEKPDFVMSSIVFRDSGHYQYDDNGARVDMAPGFDAYWDSPEYDDREVFVVFGSLYYCDMVEAGAATDNLFANQFNTDKFAIQVVDFLQEKPELLNFLKKHPEKIGQFATKLGIELPKPQFTIPDKFSALKSFLGFSEKEPDTTELDAANARITELEGLLQSEKDTNATAVEGFENRIEELEKENEVLKERVPEPTPLKPGGKGEKNGHQFCDITQRAIAAYESRNK